MENYKEFVAEMLNASKVCYDNSVDLLNKSKYYESYENLLLSAISLCKCLILDREYTVITTDANNKDKDTLGSMISFLRVLFTSSDKTLLFKICFYAEYDSNIKEIIDEYKDLYDNWSDQIKYNVSCTDNELSYLDMFIARKQNIKDEFMNNKYMLAVISDKTETNENDGPLAFHGNVYQSSNLTKKPEVKKPTLLNAIVKPSVSDFFVKLFLSFLWLIVCNFIFTVLKAFNK